MSNLTLDDFQRYCSESKYTKVIYDTVNNPAAFFDPLHLSLSFERVIVTNCPEIRSITLKSTTGVMTFDNVQRVTLNREYSLVNSKGKPCGWDIASVVCKTFNDEDDKTYTLLFDY